MLRRLDDPLVAWRLGSSGGLQRIVVKELVVASLGRAFQGVVCVLRVSNRREPLHPLRSAAPEQKGCSAYGSGVLLLVLRLLWWCVALCCGVVCVLSASSRRGVLDPLRGAAPVAGRCTRYVALHPNRRGVVLTDRVQLP